MNRLESKIIDIFDDVNLKDTLTKVASKLPGDLTQVDLPTIEERNGYDDTHFALSVITKTANRLNKFPINSRLNTALSNEYFDLNHHKLPSEAQKTAATYIKLACERYGVKPSESVKVAAAKNPVMTNLYIENITDKPGGRLVTKEAQAADSEY